MREKTRRHRQLEILNRRYTLSIYEVEELQKLDAGYEGELIFDGLLGAFINGTNIIHIKDYNFYPANADHHLLTRPKDEAAHVQVDNVVIAKDSLYTFEIKNYNFDLHYEDAKWYFENGNDFTDPLMQLVKQRDMLVKLFRGMNHQIRMFNVLVFINKNQTIFNLPARNEIIVRSNLQKKLSKAMMYNHYDHSSLAANLESRRAGVLKYQGDTTVEFRELAKGVFCISCTERLVRVNHYKFKCAKCSEEIPVLDVVKQLIMELGILNRSWTVTPSLIQQYSDHEISEYCVRDNKNRGLLDF
ncbi:nuclease-related domain-containing protein [Lacicoccus alkaliphilus]|uniref:Nuclease-related domain-containing protein n=1 Tax=Lacicoccus alkaliphilus DSM 16010 TaxID=1123231 RepID=A0A1M7C228_9BACL|nr:nuclease-related domain-containing protein [Salinicoccus alkaliphilus]SHL61271.1 Nuclease-related domain-containing protein [Salinicoccus alkaliphilus DSM 16010]